MAAGASALPPYFIGLSHDNQGSALYPYTVPSDGYFFLVPSEGWAHTVMSVKTRYDRRTGTTYNMTCNYFSITYKWSIK